MEKEVQREKMMIAGKRRAQRGRRDQRRMSPREEEKRYIER